MGMVPSSRFDAGDGRAHGRTEPGRTYQVPMCTGLAPPRTTGRADTLGHVPRRIALIGRFLLLANVMFALVGCAGGAQPSFDPTGPCTVDGRAPGAYPDLEARVPRTYRETSPATLDSGRNCSEEVLGSLAESIDELRFAGATWSFGGERALALVVFTAPGLSAPDVAEFYEQSARTTPRMEILAEAEPIVAGRPGWRLDAKRVERLQTVVVWPAADDDVVNVIISNDLPDERIADAIAAFGDR
jgi:hypothetical protein